MKLDRIFGSHMVFAAGLPIRIYGSGCGEGRVRFASQTVAVRSDSERWQVELSAMSYGGPYELIFESGGERVCFDDIYIGDVYMFSGQSNMQFKLKSSSTPPSEYRSLDRLRMFCTDRLESGEPYTADDGWNTLNADKAADWSALAYLCGIELASENVTIGIIACYQGASVIESWVPRRTFEDRGIIVPIEKRHSDHINTVYSRWNSDGFLYDYAVKQVIPYSLSGVVWYQGESDSSVVEANMYGRELEAMINVWRDAFCNRNLHFVVVQIADFCYRNDDAWRAVQQAQLETAQRVENVSCVISADVCEDNNIHPPTKDALAHRIAIQLRSLWSR